MLEEVCSSELVSIGWLPQDADRIRDISRTVDKILRFTVINSL